MISNYMTDFKDHHHFTFNGKEKDPESGFHYYGARYYWSELLTGWLSVDPMADKYPSISPYGYCAWNPVKLVDPDGRELSERMEEYAEKIISFCQRKIDALNKSNGYIEFPHRP